MSIRAWLSFQKWQKSFKFRRLDKAHYRFILSAEGINHAKSSELYLLKKERYGAKKNDR